LLQETWDAAQAAADLGPLPAGTYRCRIIDGRLFTAQTGTLGYKITFEIIDCEYPGRRIWLDVWLSPAAMPIAKRELTKVRITHLDQLERPLPARLLASVKLALRRDDDGAEHNRVVRFEVTGIETPKPEPFAPTPSTNDQPGDAGTIDAGGFDWQAGRQTEGDTP
jgi:hypothetical protein